MSENKWLSPIEIVEPESPAISHEIKQIIDETHAGAMSELPKIVSDQTNFIRIFAREIRVILNWTDPQTYSDLTSAMIALRASHDKKFEEKA